MYRQGDPAFEDIVLEAAPYSAHGQVDRKVVLGGDL
jgi:hypothetical protein